MTKPVSFLSTRSNYKVIHLDGSGTRCPVLFYGPDRRTALKVYTQAHDSGKAVSLLTITELQSTYDNKVAEVLHGR